jgi:hypothetical protein
MDWDAIGAIAESAAALGVIASLIYLATQIRHNTRASSVEAKLATTGMLNEFLNMFITDPELYGLFMQGRASTENLSEEEYRQFSNLVMKTFWFCSAAHFQLRTGTLQQEDWREIESILEFWLDGEGVRRWWHRFGHQRFGKSFAEFVDAELVRAEARATTS